MGQCGPAPSPVPIRASGSVRSASSRTGGRSQRPLNAENSQPTEDEEAEKEKFINPETTESMWLEMEYDADRAWYDAEEGKTVFDGDTFYLRDEASVKKKEAEVRKDGISLTLAQSKKLSQLTADNAQWEDRQLMRSGAVRGTDVQTVFDDEEERRVILLVHGLDVLANAKRVEGSFKVLRPNVSSMMASIDEDVEKSSLADQDDVGSGPAVGKIETESTVIQVEAKRLIQKVSPKKNDLLDMLLPHIQSMLLLHLEVPEVVIIGVLDMMHQNMIGRRHECRVVSRSYSDDRDYGDRSEPSPRHRRGYRDYDNKRSRYESSRRTPGNWTLKVESLGEISSK